MIYDRVRRGNIEVKSLGDDGRKTILRGGTWDRYLPTEHLVYINKGTLFADNHDDEFLRMGHTHL